MSKVTPSLMAGALQWVAVFILLVAAAFSTFAWGNTEPRAIYFLLILLFATVWGFRDLAEAPAEWDRSDAWKWLIPLLAVSVLGAYLRLHNLGASLVWTDEDNHNGLVLLRADTVNVAAWSQQPPMYYYLSLFGRKLLGNSAFGLRFNSALFGAMAVPLFYALLLRIYRNYFFALLGGLVFAVDAWLVSYSIEAKPYACGVFFSVMFLHATFSFMLDSSLARALSWLTATLLFLLSIGFQPLIFAAAFTAGSIFVFAANRNFRHAATAAAGTILALLLFAPFLLNTIANSNGFLRIPAPEVFSWAHAREFGVHFAWQWCLLLGQSGCWGLLFLVPAVALLGAHERKPSAKFLDAVTLAGVFFPVIFFFVYGCLIVNYEVTPRHILLFLPMFYLMVAGGCIRLEKRISGRLGGMGRLVWRGVALTLALLFCLGAVGRSERTQEFKWIRAYEFLRQHARPGDLAFYFTLGQPGLFSSEGFLLTDYYYSPELREKVRITSRWEAKMAGREQVGVILDSFERGDQPAQIFLFYQEGENQVPFPKFHFARTPVDTVSWKPGPDYLPFSGRMLVLKVEKNMLDAWKGFLLDVDEQEGRTDVKLRLYELLAGVEIYQGNCGRAAAALERLRRIPTYRYLNPQNLPRLEDLFRKKCPQRE